jgi:diguanylate cyclase (GGDEF)-like protein
MADKIAFILCEHYLNEAEKALSKEGFDNNSVAVLPARCGRPVITTTELTEIAKSLGDAGHIEVFGSACIAGLSDFSINGCSIHINKLNSCFELLADSSVIDAYINKGAYLTTPGWLSNWSENLKQMGLDQKTAMDMFAETTTVIALIESGIDNKSIGYLKAFAFYLEKPYEIIPAGISILRLIFRKSELAWKLKQNEIQYAAEIHELRKKSATNAMAIDLLSSLALTIDENKAIEAMLDVYMMLFAPKKLFYLRIEDGKPEELWSRPPMHGLEEITSIKKMLSEFNKDSSYMKTGNTFLMRISRQDEVRGVIALEEIAFPEHIDHYIDLALSIGSICELPIANAHKYQKIIQTEEMLRKANEDLLQLATTDSLTGIANRRAYDEYIEVEWKKMMRNKTPLSLIISDIDFFKKYNDYYGHKDGDYCLYSVAQIMRKMVMRPGDFIARYGGEEFIAILPNTPIEGAFHIAEKFRSSVAEYDIKHMRSESSAHVTISAGVSCVTVDEVKKNNYQPDDLFRSADSALYEAKRQGRNRTVIQKININITQQ